MKKHVFIYFLVLVSFPALAQTKAPDEYYKLVKTADSLYKERSFVAAACSYSAAFRAFDGTGYSKDRYNAACCWALTGFADSAFLNLHRIAEKANYADYRGVVWEDDLLPLHRDKRWNPYLKMVAQNRARNDSAAGYNKPLLHLIDSLTMEDQEWRSYSRRHANHRFAPGEDTLTDDQIVRKAATADSLNYYAINAIFRKYGFPDFDLVGPERSNDFWALVQHQDNHPALQDSVLEKMKIKVDAKKASGVDYAYLVDRVNVNTGKLQVYGSQFVLNADSTAFVPKEVIDPDKLNERRKSVGMGPEEAYIEYANKRFSGKLKKKK